MWQLSHNTTNVFEICVNFTSRLNTSCPHLSLSSIHLRNEIGCFIYIFCVILQLDTKMDLMYVGTISTLFAPLLWLCACQAAIWLRQSCPICWQLHCVVRLKIEIPKRRPSNHPYSKTLSPALLKESLAHCFTPLASRLYIYCISALDLCEQEGC